MDVTLRPSVPGDIDWLVELRAVVLRHDLERLGRYDDVRVRERMRASFVPAWTRIVMADGAEVGSITTRPDGEARWIEHFYLAPEAQSRGIGTIVLRTVLDEPHHGATRLNVLQGSAARRLYERLGFVVESEDEIDVFMRLRELPGPFERAAGRR
ncbi:N-acetyltransferase [Microbacterium sorbitolivorans]|uniref:N-acetyltransferase n=1 Tax=Microbacterium sorbitolivorans TaxID=1867410 RepID=A0A367Y2Z8_9MICO|nr:GNAT family N-acetyltransferase [Microbacterium sorbitolivorans]RCK60207.1 N-acetyltransferase [Microbacterium sorbitolivorans]GGF48784.1 N-acetyltransferase [Microbacterium sorbitolivorans]